MPVHDWTRVPAGTVHDFYLAWIAELRRALNGGLLPESYYAMAEQVADEIIPDVLTLQDMSRSGEPPDRGDHPAMAEDPDGGGVAVATAPPRVSVSDVFLETDILATRRRRRIVIRHTTGDRIVAFIEIVSQGNKTRKPAFEAFLEKAGQALEQGYHLLVCDLFPPGTYDPAGIHGAICEYFGAGAYVPAVGKPLTLAAYAAVHQGDVAVRSYVEPTAVNDTLISMPLFLNADHYVNVPLEATYLAAFEGVPQRWKKIIDG